jgi:hypothetical protein
VNWQRVLLLKEIPLTVLFIYAPVRVTGFSACTSCEEKHNEISAEKKSKDPFSVIMAESLPVVAA